MKTFTSDYLSTHLADVLSQLSPGEECVITDGQVVIAHLIRANGQRPDAFAEAHAPREEVEQAFHGD